MNQYTQIDEVHPKITHFKHILGYTFLKIPATHTQNMFSLCKLFSRAIYSMGYFCNVTRLHTDQWKLMFLSPNQLGHYIIYFHSALKCFVTSTSTYCELPCWLLIRVKNCIMYTIWPKTGAPSNGALFNFCQYLLCGNIESEASDIYSSFQVFTCLC